MCHLYDIYVDFDDDVTMKQINQHTTEYLIVGKVYIVTQ